MGQMSLRAASVYVIAIVIVRIGKKWFMSRGTAFDLILAIVFGSIVSRVITGDAPFLPGIAAVLTLVLMHWLFSAASLRWKEFSRLVKGQPVLLVRDGIIVQEGMKRTHISDGNLRQDLRQKGVSALGEVAEAHLEPNGEVSVIRKS